MSNLDEELMSIGAFAQRARLSPKALRLYDELGLLAPARVDESSGYRYYEAGQLERARLLASLRRVGMPLAEIKAILELEPAPAAEPTGSRSRPSTPNAASSPPTSSIASTERGRSCTRSKPGPCRRAACCA